MTAYYLEGKRVQLAPMDHVEPPKNEDPHLLETMTKMYQLNMVSSATMMATLQKSGILPAEHAPKDMTITDMTDSFAKNHWGLYALQEFDFKPGVIFMIADYPSMPELIREARKVVKGKLGVIFSKDSEGRALTDKPMFIALETREDGALFKLFFG